MEQLILISEKELNDLKIKANYCDLYANTLTDIQEKFYPNHISVDPINHYQYNYIILKEMYYELQKKRKVWWNKILCYLH